MHPATQSSIDQSEVDRFSALAARWWDERGPFKPLHALNAVRIGFIRDTVAGGRWKVEDTPAVSTHHLSPFTPLTLLDIGCGGGLVAEPMARLGTSVTAIDASEACIGAAQTHAKNAGLTHQLAYRCATAEELAAEGQAFDVVLALEIVEHVADPTAFISTCLQLIKPGGLFICSTLNRTPWSYAMAIIGAEVVLRLLPRGTHDWKKFLRPSELAAMVEAGGGSVTQLMGMVFNPLQGWRLAAQDLRVNYLLVARK